MTRFIGLLRGINVGGNNLIAMAQLRALVESLGFTDARTLLQSGNVVFDGGRKSPAAIETLFEKTVRERLGPSVDWFVRTADELDAVIADDPDPRASKSDPSHYLVYFLKSAPAAKNAAAMQAALKTVAAMQAPRLSRERVHVRGRHLYVTYPDGIGKSKLTMPWLERQLGCSGTARNWNTLRKLQVLARAH